VNPEKDPGGGGGDEKKKKIDKGKGTKARGTIIRYQQPEGSKDPRRNSWVREGPKGGRLEGKRTREKKKGEAKKIERLRMKKRGSGGWPGYGPEQGYGGRRIENKVFGQGSG